MSDEPAVCVCGHPADKHIIDFTVEGYDDWWVGCSRRGCDDPEWGMIRLTIHGNGPETLVQQQVRYVKHPRQVP